MNVVLAKIRLAPATEWDQTFPTFGYNWEKVNALDCVGLDEFSESCRVSALPVEGQTMRITVEKKYSISVYGVLKLSKPERDKPTVYPALTVLNMAHLQDSNGRDHVVTLDKLGRNLTEAIVVPSTGL